jgi:zinc transporter ZupT
MGVQGDWGAALGAATTPVLAAWVGAVIGAVGAGGRRALTVWVVHFAAGAFLALAVAHLLPEAAAGLRWPGALLSAGLGLGVCWLLTRWAGGFCPACSLEDAGPIATQLQLPLLAVITLHSALDGLALTHGAEHARQHLALVSAVVLVHKVPEGLAVAAVARAAGRTALAALLITMAVEACTFLGLAAGTAIGGLGAGFLAGAQGVTAGSFLYLAGLTLAPDRTSPRAVPNLIAAVIGAAVTGAALLLPGAG